MYTKEYQKCMMTNVVARAAWEAASRAGLSQDEIYEYTIVQLAKNNDELMKKELDRLQNARYRHPCILCGQRPR